MGSDVEHWEGVVAALERISDSVAELSDTLSSIESSRSDDTERMALVIAAQLLRRMEPHVILDLASSDCGVEAVRQTIWDLAHKLSTRPTVSWHQPAAQEVP